MSNTRHAPPGAPISPNRYASSPETARELHGNLVALRCATLDRREDRELVFALQAIVNEIGSKEFAARFLARFSGHLGTQSMRAIGIDGKRYNTEQVKAVRCEIPGDASSFLLRGEEERSWEILACDESKWEELDRREREEAARRPTSYPVSAFLEICTDTAKAELVGEINKLTIDPAVSVVCGPWYFHELITCLREFVNAWATSQLGQFRGGFAHTKLSRTIFAEITDAHELGGTVLLHNSSGNGKSHAAEAYCIAHPGRARYVLTPATNNEVDFWRAIADALGTASGNSFKCDQIRTRAVKTLLGSGLALVLDNSQWLFPVRDYRYALPNRLNQVLQLAEQGVPVVMISNSKFFDMLGFIEIRTGWDRSKFVNKLSRLIELPGTLAKDDVQAVAAALLPDGERSAQRKLADYMIVAQNYLHSGKQAAQRSRRIAATNNRATVALADVEEAINGWMVPAFQGMEAALKRADVAAAKCKSKGRNWRPDTDAQIAAKAGKRRNAIVTSSDLERADASPVRKTVSTRPEARLNGDFSDVESPRFTAREDSAERELATV